MTDRPSARFIEDIGPIKPLHPATIADARAYLTARSHDAADLAHLLDITGIEPIDHGRPTNRGAWNQVRAT